MKKIYAFLAAILLVASLFAQSPEKMSYQAVIRNNNNKLVSNQVVGMQISILKNSDVGTPVYVETQTPSTNSNGIVSIEIGTGKTNNEFATIDWGNGIYFVKTETDLTGGTNYSITSSNQLLSVPYALHAKTADSISGTIEETDPVFKASVAARITQADTANWNNQIDDLLHGNTGYQQIGNLVMQFGTLYSTTNSSEEFEFPKSFKTMCHGVFIQREDENSLSILPVKSLDMNGFTINREEGFNQNGSYKFYWFAIGY